MKQLFKNNWKRMLSGLLVIALLIGLVPWDMGQVEAAYTEVSLKVGASGLHAQEANARYLIYLDAENFDEATLDANAIWGNNTIYIDGEAVGSSNVRDDINYHKDANQLLLTVKYGVFGDNITSASGVGNHTIIIPAGTIIGGALKTNNDIGFVIQGADIREGKVTSFELAGVTAQDEAVNHRYLFTFNISGATAKDYWNNNTVYIDGNKVATDVNGAQSINYVKASDSQLLFLLDYNYVETGKTTSGALEQVHTLEIPSGTALVSQDRSQDIILKNSLCYTLDKNNITPAESSVDVTVTPSEPHAPAATGFQFKTGNQVDNLTYDGMYWTCNYYFASGGVTYKAADDGEARNLEQVYLKKIGKDTYFVVFDAYASEISFKNGDIVTIDGQVQNLGYRVKYTKTSFQYDGSAWSVYEEPSGPTQGTLTFTNTQGGAWQGTRWLTYLTSTETVPADGTSIESGLSIEVANGDAKTTYPLNADDLVVVGGKWALLLPTASYSAVPTPEQTNGEYYTVTLKAGTAVDNSGNSLTIGVDVPILYSNGEAQGVIVAKTDKLITTTGTDKGGTDGIYFDTATDNGLAYSGDWSARPFVECGSVSIDGTALATTNRSLIKTTGTSYYLSLNPGETGNVPSSLAVGSEMVLDFYASDADGSGKVVYFPETTFELTASGWVKKENKLAVTLQDDDRNSDPTVNTTDGFYFTVTPQDALAYDGANWSARYVATEGGVTVDEELKSNVQLIKLAENLYYVALSDAQITPAKGMQVTIDGTYGNETAAVQMMAATFVYHGDGKWTLGGSVEEETYSEAVYTVHDIFEFLQVSSVTVPNDSNFNLLDLGKNTNVALRAEVTADYANEYQDFTLALSKSVANNIWVESGYQIKFFPHAGRVRIMTGADTVVADVQGVTAIEDGEFSVEYGVIDMLNEQSELAARKVYVKIDGVDTASYLDKDLTRELGTYVPVYAYSHPTAGEDFSLKIGSVTHKGYELVAHTPKVQDVSELMDGLATKELMTGGETHVGALEKSKDIAVKTKVIFHSDFSTYGDTRCDELKIGIEKTDSQNYWDVDKSGYELWLRPDALCIGYEYDKIGAMTAYEVPDEFTLEFGSYDIEIQKDGVKTGDYGTMVYVKIDGQEVLSWLDTSKDRVLGKEVLTCATETVDVDFKSLTSTKYLIRQSNTVADIYDATGLSEVKLNKANVTKLGELSQSTSIALRTKVKMNTDFKEFKLAMSKTDPQQFWDIDASGWQFWFRPELGQVFVGYGVSEYGAVVGHEFKEEFILEIGERDVVYSTGGNYGREIYVKIDGKDVLSWVDKDYERPLSKYLVAYATEEADVTLISLTTEGYVPVDQVAAPVDIFDVSQYPSVNLTRNECMNLGSMDNFINKSIKMNVKVNKDASEFKIATAKKDKINMWDLEASGWQFWFRPASSQIFIGYGVSEYAEVTSFEFPEEFELEIGARKVYYQNGKYMGVRIFINIDGKEVLSWIDTDASRILGEYIVSYAADDSNITLSTLYPTKELPVTYLVNGEAQTEFALADVTSTVVVGKDSRISVEILKDKNSYVDYKRILLNDQELEPEEEKTDVFAGNYTYMLTTPKKSERLIVELETYELTTDEAKVFDFYEVAGTEAITVKTGEDRGIGNLIDNGNACGVNTAMQFIVDIPKEFNSIRVGILGDSTGVWGFRGSLLNIQNGKVLIQYPATQRTLSQAASSLFAPGSSVAIEFGIVKCYADGVYKYDRAYVKAGNSIDDMELITWYDNTQRGAYGTGVMSRGTDIEGVNFTLRSAKELHKVTDASEQKVSEVFYPTYVIGGSQAEIKLYTEEGQKLNSLTVAGKRVNASVAEDGAYVYQTSKISDDVKFAYTIGADNSSYKVTAQTAEHLEIAIREEIVAAAGSAEVLIKADKGYVLSEVLINGSDWLKEFTYDEEQKGWAATITGIREDKVIKATATEKQYTVSVKGVKGADITLGGDTKDNILPAGGTLEVSIEAGENQLIQSTYVNEKPVVSKEGLITVDNLYSVSDEIVVEVVLKASQAVRVASVLSSPLFITTSVSMLAGAAIIILLIVKGKKKGAKVDG